MAITIADQYYLKALDEYPYCLEDAIENLNYALGYDENHVGANCLMGRVYVEQFKDLEKAEQYFQLALAEDPLHIQTCIAYCDLMIVAGDFKHARKLIKYTCGLKGINLAMMLWKEALIYEHEKDYAKAIMLLKSAMEETCNNGEMHHLKGELKRVEGKQKRRNKYNVDLV